MQYTTVHHSILQYITVYYTVHHSILQYITVYYTVHHSILYSTSQYTIQYITVYYSTSQYTTVHLPLQLLYSQLVWLEAVMVLYNGHCKGTHGGCGLSSMPRHGDSDQGWLSGVNGACCRRSTARWFCSLGARVWRWRSWIPIKFKALSESPFSHFSPFRRSRNFWGVTNGQLYCHPLLLLHLGAVGGQAGGNYPSRGPLL